MRTNKEDNLAFWARSARTHSAHLKALADIVAAMNTDPDKIAELIRTAAVNAETIAEGIETA